MAIRDAIKTVADDLGLDDRYNLEFWKEVKENPKNKMSDRLNASNKIAKAIGTFDRDSGDELEPVKAALTDGKDVDGSELLDQSKDSLEKTRQVPN